MLPAERCDPHVVGRDWPAGAFQFRTDGRVVPRGLDSNIKDGASIQHSLQGPFVRLAVPRLRDTESELPGYDYRDRKLTRLGHEGRLVLEGSTILPLTAALTIRPRSTTDAVH